MFVIDTIDILSRSKQWILTNSEIFYSARYGHTSVVLSDGTVFVIGGSAGSFYFNDVWKSTNGCSVWVTVTSNAKWKGTEL